MRWTKPTPTSLPAHGAHQERQWFAWLPVTIGRETRWLETVKVELYYNECYVCWIEPGWGMIRFLPLIYL